jgi:Myb-like DNA-binding protein FlbD
MVPSHRHGPWVPEEDQLLLQLVREQGPKKWVRISQRMHNRSPKQCCERFQQILKPSLNREPISPDEGLLIESMVHDMGKCWAEIARRLGNRSDNAVKNWWNGRMNRKRRGLSTSPASRTFNGCIKTPSARASIVSFSPPRLATHLWAKSSMDSSEVFSHPRRESTVSTTSQLSPIYTLSSIKRPIEPPLPSPAFSDVSHATSIELPFMVPDHNFVSFSSPRTLPSLQLLPTPADVRTQYDARRPSAASVRVVDDSPPSCPSRSLVSLSEIASRQRWMEHLPVLAFRHQTTDSLPKPWKMRHVKPARDTRMGLDNILN